MKYSTYLFDLDGTLYSRDDLVRQLIEEQYREFCNELAHIDRAVYVERVVELDAHGYHPKEQLYVQIAEEWDLDSGVRSRLLEHFWDAYDSHCRLPGDSLTTLQTLQNRGVRLGLVTNGRTQRQTSKIDALGIRSYFDAILISEAEGLKKPAPELFHRAVDRCGGDAEDTVFIGDHPVADIGGARGAGLAAVWKKVSYWHMSRADVVVIDKLSEILE